MVRVNGGTLGKSSRVAASFQKFSLFKNPKDFLQDYFDRRFFGISLGPIF
jgi:hypothetical protein